jgi:hypothetical protein
MGLTMPACISEAIECQHEGQHNNALAARCPFRYYGNLVDAVGQVPATEQPELPGPAGLGMALLRQLFQLEGEALLQDMALEMLLEAAEPGASWRRVMRVPHSLGPLVKSGAGCQPTQLRAGGNVARSAPGSAAICGAAEEPMPGAVAPSGVPMDVAAPDERTFAPAAADQHTSAVPEAESLCGEHL